MVSVLDDVIGVGQRQLQEQNVNFDEISETWKSALDTPVMEWNGMQWIVILLSLCLVSSLLRCLCSGGGGGCCCFRQRYYGGYGGGYGPYYGRGYYGGYPGGYYGHPRNRCCCMDCEDVICCLCCYEICCRDCQDVDACCNNMNGVDPGYVGGQFA